ncbi:putative quinone oxidoreductase [Myriangium duriaei CBS 260.36]|uniref:Quinone oxidoreductase n=1 Tax=Myriangium duriaei CBS 260.36 TaxID=1168546 RepID=A0A9P4IXA9_9PEZI|nr:putative quinone oxidoreductase [Myriangium duriaei CBS 260.36]
MSSEVNQAAYLDAPGTKLTLRQAPMPTPGPGEIVVKNHAIAINPLDTHQVAIGVFVQQWPAVIGCDVAGEVHDVGAGVSFLKGDRVIGHAINLVTGRPSDGTYQHYTIVRADKAAILPDHITFDRGVVIPFAIEAAVCALCAKTPGVAMPGVATPALSLPFPALGHIDPIGNILVVYGASSSVGSMAVQLASSAMGIHVIALCGAKNAKSVSMLGATEVFDHRDPDVVSKVVDAVKQSGDDFVGIFDAVSTEYTYARDLKILENLDGGHLATVHPPPSDVPENVKSGMIFAVNDIAGPVYRNFVTSALESGQLKPWPPARVVGKGLVCINEALELLKTGVSATKLVVELR